MYNVTCEAVWLVNLMNELNVSITLPISLLCDNNAAMSIASNPVFHERTKHFEVDLFFLREKISSGFIKPQSIMSKDQLADLFTKGLLVGQHENLCKNLGLFDEFRA
jgi:hypothetical protein